MAYDNNIGRGDVAALIPEQVAAEVIEQARDQSAVLQLFRRIPVGRNQVRFPVLSALPVVYWVTGDTGLKQTTEMAWANKFLNIEELAAIVPIPDAVIDDASFDIWGEVRPALVEAVGRQLDGTVLFGSNAPASFPDDVNAATLAAGNSVTADAVASAGGIADGMDEALGVVEDDGFDPTGWFANRRLRSFARRNRNAQGDRIAGFSPNLGEYDGLPIRYGARGAWPAAGAGAVLGFVGDWQQFVVGVRQDITFKVFTEGVIQDGNGDIVYNLMQQDMQAMRVVFRAGWEVANPLTLERPTEADRYPAARLLQAA